MEGNMGRLKPISKYSFLLIGKLNILITSDAEFLDAKANVGNVVGDIERLRNLGDQGVRIMNWTSDPKDRSEDDRVESDLQNNKPDGPI
jgi:hypothetical protein